MFFLAPAKAHKLASLGDTDALGKFLLSRKGIINKKYKGKTLLSVAIDNANMSMVVMLILRGADVNLPCSNNLLPLQISIMKRCEDISLVLVTRGASLSVVSKGGDSLLHLCVKYDCARTLVELIKRRIPIDNVNDAGETALLTALRYKRSNIALLLIENGADINARDKSGKSVQDVAYEDNNLGILNAIDYHIHKAAAGSQLTHQTIASKIAAFEDKDEAFTNERGVDDSFQQENQEEEFGGFANNSSAKVAESSKSPVETPSFSKKVSQQLKHGAAELLTDVMITASEQLRGSQSGLIKGQRSTGVRSSSKKSQSRASQDDIMSNNNDFVSEIMTDSQGNKVKVRRRKTGSQTASVTSSSASRSRKSRRQIVEPPPTEVQMICGLDRKRLNWCVIA